MPLPGTRQTAPARSLPGSRTSEGLEHMGDDGKRRKASPIRFVCGCENGHLQGHRLAAHRPPELSRPRRNRNRRSMPRTDVAGKMRVRALDRAIPGSSVTAAHLWSLEELFSLAASVHVPASGPGSAIRIRRLAMHLRGFAYSLEVRPTPYFPQVARVVSMPQTVDELARRIEAFLVGVAGVHVDRRYPCSASVHPALRASLEPYSDEAVLTRLKSMSSGSTQIDAAEDPRIAEFQLLASGAPLIGANNPGSHLHAETLDRKDWDPDQDPAARGISPSSPSIGCARLPACMASRGSSRPRWRPTSLRMSA